MTRPELEPGKVYLLGAGPGDPELITVRARRRLAEADLVLYDALVHPDLLALCKPGAEQVFVGKRAGRVSERQGDINARMVTAARQGRTVARLKGGDPYLFGRGSEEAEHLRAAGIEVEVVPGVPSAIAAATHTGISLTHRDLASSIAYVTATESPEKVGSAHDWSKLATATQTLVIFMGVRKLAQLMDVLVANGRSPDCPAAVVQSASLPSQRVVVGTVATLAGLVTRAGIGMPALTIVGEVVRLRESLRWFDLAPLFGKRVLVTRAADQSPALCQLLRDQGAEPVPMPAIAIAPPEDPAPLARAVAAAATYTCIAFSSENGVDAFFAELGRQGRDARAFGAASVAAIGPGTRNALLAHGVRADLMPERHVGEALADAITASLGAALPGARVLLPRATAARDALPERLRAAGARVDDVPAYRTLGPDPSFGAELRARIDAGELDAATFTSASTLEHTVHALDALEPGSAARLLSRLTVASIGPITTEAALRLCVRVDATADPHTLQVLVDALGRAFKEKT